MHQELFDIPFTDFTIYTYGPIMALGFLLAFFLMYHIAKLRQEDVDFYMDLYILVILGGLLGAKLLYNIVEYEFFLDLLKREGFFSALFNVMNCRNGGLVWYGGVLLDLVIIWWYARRRGIPVLQVMDTMAAPLALGLAVGRWGCLMGGCCYGGAIDIAVQTKLGVAAGIEPGLGEMLRESVPWWAIKYPENAVNVPSGWVHPAPLYASLYCFAIAGIIYAAIRKGARRGAPALLWLTLYPAARSSQEFVRGDVVRGFIYRGENFFISTSQFLGILIFLTAIAGWIIVFRRPAKGVVTVEDQKPKAEEKKGPPPKDSGKQGKPKSGKGGSGNKGRKKKTDK